MLLAAGCKGWSSVRALYDINFHFTFTSIRAVAAVEGINRKVDPSLKNKYPRKSWPSVGLSPFFHWRGTIKCGLGPLFDWCLLLYVTLVDYGEKTPSNCFHWSLTSSFLVSLQLRVHSTILVIYNHVLYRCYSAITPPRLAELCDSSFCHSFCLWARKLIKSVNLRRPNMVGWHGHAVNL